MKYELIPSELSELKGRVNRRDERMTYIRRNKSDDNTVGIRIGDDYVRVDVDLLLVAIEGSNSIDDKRVKVLEEAHVTLEKVANGLLPKG